MGLHAWIMELHDWIMELNNYGGLPAFDNQFAM